MESDQCTLWPAQGHSLFSAVVENDPLQVVHVQPEVVVVLFHFEGSGRLALALDSQGFVREVVEKQVLDEAEAHEMVETGACPPQPGEQS